MARNHNMDRGRSAATCSAALPFEWRGSWQLWELCLQLPISFPPLGLHMRHLRRLVIANSRPRLAAVCIVDEQVITRARSLCFVYTSKSSIICNDYLKLV